MRAGTEKILYRGNGNDVLMIPTVFFFCMTKRVGSSTYLIYFRTKIFTLDWREIIWHRIVSLLIC